MYAASFFKLVVNIPRSLCFVVGGVMSGALYLGGVMTVNPLKRTKRIPLSHCWLARPFLKSFV